MINIKRLMRRTFLIISILLLFNVNTLAEVCISFDENINKLEGVVSIEDSKEFIENDKSYLNNKPKKEKINREIKELEMKLKLVENEFEIVNNIRIYKGNTGLKNNALRTAIKNRKEYIKDRNSFKYNDKTIYTIDRGYAEELGTNRYFEQREMDIIYNAITETLKNIEIDTKFLENTKFVISPFILEGINGYTVSRSNNKSTIVISNHVLGVSEDWFMKFIKSTTLHEIGHVFQNTNENKFKNNTVANEYLLEADRILSSKAEDTSTLTKEWKTSVNENFAEDFRIYFSSRLGDKSFKAFKKKTLMEYNEKEIGKVIEDIIK